MTSVFLICVLGFLYFLPLFVAHARHHRNLAGIGVLDFLLGWTVLAWIAALVWACSVDAVPAAHG